MFPRSKEEAPRILFGDLGLMDHLPQYLGVTGHLQSPTMYYIVSSSYTFQCPWLTKLLGLPNSDKADHENIQNHGHTSIGLQRHSPQLESPLARL